MGTTLTPIVAQLRGGSEHQRFGDPYAWSATVLIIGHEAHISGLIGQPSLAELIAIRQRLREMGVCQINFERMEGGACVARSVKI